MKVCPVCGWRIEGDGVGVVVGGERLTVCCDECAAKAKQHGAGGAKP